MNSLSTPVSSQALWQALSAQQRQQLLARLGKWVLRARPPRPLSPRLPPASSPQPGGGYELQPKTAA